MYFRRFVDMGYNHCYLLFLISKALRLFQLNSQAIGNAIDEGIVGRYGAYVVDGPVVKSLRAQGADVCFSHVTWRTGEFNCIIQHGKISCLQVCLPVIRGQRGQHFLYTSKFRAFDFQ